MKGYKGFEKGLVCRGKQYKENTVFEEDAAIICQKGMHFCENPFDVLAYYPFIDNNGNLNEYAEVEAIVEAKTDDNIKYVTTKLKVGAKIGINELVDAFIRFTFERIKKTKTSTGDRSVASSTGDRSVSITAGDQSVATVGKGGSVAIVTGFDSKAKASIGSAICVCERGKWNGKEFPLIGIKAAIIDGQILKADTFYKLVNGEFVEVE